MKFLNSTQTKKIARPFLSFPLVSSHYISYLCYFIYKKDTFFDRIYRGKTQKTVKFNKHFLNYFAEC